MIVTSHSNLTKLLATFVVMVGIILLLVSNVTINMDSDTSANGQAVESKPIDGFSLINHDDKEITSDTFLGHWTFVFFGFTNCPDVCPATLSQLVQINKLISQQSSLAGKFQTLFVSVDPDRDDKKHIKDYVKYFDPSFIGATGDMNNIIAFEKQFGAFHIIGNKRLGNYNVGHSSSVFLVNPDGVYSTKFSPPMDVTMVIKTLDKFVKGY